MVSRLVLLLFPSSANRVQDLITYKVSREKPFRVIESVKGDGEYTRL